MTAKQQWIVVAVIVALMGGGLAAGSYFLRDELQPLSIGSKAPQFSALTMDAVQKTKTLDDYKGQVVLLNVWRTDCGPCRTEMPSIEALHHVMTPKGLHIVAVSVDLAGKTQLVRDFVKEFNLSFEILNDTSGTIEQKYQTTGVPESFVIGRDGTIHKKWIGEDNWNSVGNRKLIEQLLAEPAR